MTRILKEKLHFKYKIISDSNQNNEENTVNMNHNCIQEMTVIYRHHIQYIPLIGKLCSGSGEGRKTTIHTHKRECGQRVPRFIKKTSKKLNMSGSLQFTTPDDH